jgi:hypothetical protein
VADQAFWGSFVNKCVCNKWSRILALCGLIVDHLPPSPTCAGAGSPGTSSSQTCRRSSAPLVQSSPGCR